MPFYCYACPECAHTDEIVKSMAERFKEEKCPKCGTVMERDYVAEKPTHHSGGYSRPIVSDSLAMHPDQIAEHRRMFPDVKVTPEGQPVFENFQQHDSYLKKIGAVKNPAKMKKKGVRVTTKGA
jgi:putative FmdB family regulatory protein